MGTYYTAVVTSDEDLQSVCLLCLAGNSIPDARSHYLYSIVHALRLFGCLQDRSCIECLLVSLKSQRASLCGARC
jgi:hypothetical protein